MFTVMSRAWSVTVLILHSGHYTITGYSKSYNDLSNKPLKCDILNIKTSLRMIQICLDVASIRSVTNGYDQKMLHLVRVKLYFSTF